MRKLKPETLKALEADRIRLFVFFDFMFLPQRVHDGKGRIEWDGHAWEGIGKILRENFSLQNTSLVSSPTWKNEESGYTQGHLSASLPLDKTTREVVHKGYYRGRKMELFICSYDERGKIIERIEYATNPMVEISVKENVVTFRSIDDTLDSIAEKDERHKKTVEAFRQQFKSDWLGMASLIRWLTIIVRTSLGDWLVLAIAFLTAFSTSKRRDLRQRWEARQRVYWFKTTPKIPRLWTKRRGYKIRADTLDEAKEKLYREIEAKIWRFPRNWINMLIDVEGAPGEFFNLDTIRQQRNPKKWEATDPILQWGKDESKN